MYDGAIQDFMGYYDNDTGEYVYPSVPQNLVVAFSPDSPATPFYLSAIDGDFSADGVVFTTEIGPSEDTTIGNAPAKVMSASMLNPEGTMGDLPWGYGAAYIGSLQREGPADSHGIGQPVSIVVLNVGGFSIDASGNARIPGGTAFTLGGEPIAIVANHDGTDVLYITDTKIGRYLNGAFSVVTTPTASQEYLTKKYRDFPTTIGVMLDANGCPVKYNCEETNISRTYTYIPMGTYDFSDVDARGLAFTAEAYDKMVLFDSDATDWINSLDFTSPKTVSDLIDELMTVSGFTASIDSHAVNLSFSYDANPLSGYTVTYRQVLKWLAEMIGCNARMGRTDVIEFFPYINSARVYYYPDIIVSGSRTTARYNTPNICEVICYDITGTPYSSGVTPAPGMNYGSYYIVSNPLFQGLSQDTTILSTINALFGTTGAAMWGYRPTTISSAYSYPGVDVGDMIHITAMDGSTEIIPVMYQTLRWNGICSATITATGKQQRTIPDGEITSLTGSVGNSNPVAAVQGYFGGISVASADYPDETIDIFPDSIILEDATHMLTISASGPTPSSSYGSGSVTSDSNYHTIGSITISDPGTYMIIVHAAFPNNSTGWRGLLLSYTRDSSAQIAGIFSATQPPVNGTYTNMNICGVAASGSSTTLYINAHQNGGSTQTVNYSYSYVRLA